MSYRLSDFGVTFEKSRLDNGINVFSFYRKGMPVCVRVVFFAGSRFDTIPGTAHFLEHMLVAGTEKFPTKDKLAMPLERVGGEFSASTSFEGLRINISTPLKEDINVGLEILEEMLFCSLFDDKTLENERGSVLSEIDEDDEDPYAILNKYIYYPMVFKGAAQERSVAGDKDSVGRIKKDDLLKFKDSFLRAGRMCFLVSGGITTGEVLPLLKKHFASYRPEKYFKTPRPAAIIRSESARFRPFKENRQVYARIGFRTRGMGENERELNSLDLVAGVLGKGRASRLIKELRYKRGLVYGAGASHLSNIDAGQFSISTSFESGKQEKVLTVILDELKKMAEEGINADELEFAKSATNKSIFDGMETSWSWIGSHEYDMLLRPELSRTVDHYMNEIDSLKLDEVNAVAKKFIHKDNFYIALCGTDSPPKVLW